MKYVDFSKFLLDLVGVVWKGGNFGVYFSFEEEVIEEVVILIFDFCEDLIEYLFVLFECIDELNVKLKILGNGVGFVVLG